MGQQLCYALGHQRGFEMKCPACANTLSQKTAGSLTVDVCDSGCGGIFFDNFELSRVDEASEVEGEAILSWISNTPVSVMRNDRRYECPRCEMIMMRSMFMPSISVSVDTCPQCAGVWLDHGELLTIRTAPGSDTERRALAQKFITEAFTAIKANHE